MPGVGRRIGRFARWQGEVHCVVDELIGYAIG